MLLLGYLYILEPERFDEHLSVGEALAVLEALLVEDGGSLVGMVLG